MFDWSLAPADAFVHYGLRGVALVLVAWMAWLTWPVRTPDRMRLGFALILVTTLFLSPISWVHHSVLTLPALFILVNHLVSTGRLTWGRVWILAAAYTLIAIYFKPPGIFQRELLTPLASFHLAGNVMIWGLIAAELLGSRRDREEARP